MATSRLDARATRGNTRINQDQRRVVYALSDESGEWCKIGRTRNLKRRLSQLQTMHRKVLFIAFWVEVKAEDASKVESRAIRLLKNRWRVIHGREVFEATEEQVARGILSAAGGVKIYNRAGFPGAYDYEPNEIEELLSEPIMWLNKKGRLDREFWSPQARSINY